MGVRNREREFGTGKGKGDGCRVLEGKSQKVRMDRQNGFGFEGFSWDSGINWTMKMWAKNKNNGILNG